MKPWIVKLAVVAGWPLVLSIGLCLPILGALAGVQADQWLHANRCTFDPTGTCEASGEEVGGHPPLFLVLGLGGAVLGVGIVQLYASAAHGTIYGPPNASTPGRP